MTTCYQRELTEQLPKLTAKLDNAEKLLNKLYNCYVMWSTPGCYPKLDKDKIARESDKVLKTIFFDSGDGHYDVNKDWVDFTYGIQSDTYNRLLPKQIRSEELEYFAEWSLVYFYLKKMKKFILSLKSFQEIDDEDKEKQYSLSYDPYAPTMSENEYCSYLYTNCHSTVAILRSYYSLMSKIENPNTTNKSMIFGYLLEFQLASLTSLIVKNIPTNWQEDKDWIKYTGMYEEALNYWRIENQVDKMNKIYSDLEPIVDEITASDKPYPYKEALQHAFLCMKAYISSVQTFNDFIASDDTSLYSIGMDLYWAIERAKRSLVTIKTN